MAKAGQSGLEAIAAGLPRENRGPPPVELWNPPYCGDIDMKIASDGTWFYQKTPIGRLALVKLFASVLKREGDKHFLVTPVEKVGIAVEDAPFLAVELKTSRGDRGQVLEFRTNVDDWVTAGPGHAGAAEGAIGHGKSARLYNVCVDAQAWNRRQRHNHSSRSSSCPSTSLRSCVQLRVNAVTSLANGIVESE